MKKVRQTTKFNFKNLFLKFILIYIIKINLIHPMQRTYIFACIYIIVYTLRTCAV
uniref:Uncharacterized protein n=1 Tax=Oryza brachyantha TaxID=4533 RepID=J3N8N7_ORYBR